jgi:pimeloyl-ACP methyl ester carboxylesterase
VRDTRRSLPALTTVVALACCAIATSSAEARFKQCSDQPRTTCGRIAVPVDRTGAVPGSLNIYVERRRPARQVSGTIISLAGGPGQGATPLFEDFATLYERELAHRQLVIFDQRGTGHSGALRCKAVEKAGINAGGKEAAQCAVQIGTRHSLFTTRDSVADLEAVRVAVGADKLILIGTSYGTKVALAYATAYPQHVEAMVLDSPVAVESTDVYGLSSYAAVRRVLPALCGVRRCRGITRTPVGDLSRLATRLAKRPLRGFAITNRGKRIRRLVTASALMNLVLSSDLDPALLGDLPAVTRSALAGDAAPILRALRGADAVNDLGSAQDFSTALFVATTCEESAVPWQRTSPPAERQAQADAAAAALAPGVFEPFPATLGISESVVPLCVSWPQAPLAPTLASTPAPNVPTLVISGDNDLRTPREDAVAIAATLPQGHLLAVGGVGHSVLGGTLSGCPEKALHALLTGQAVRHRCEADLLAPVPTPIAPRSLRQVPPLPGLGGGRPARTATAALLTVSDGFAGVLGAVFGFLGGDQVTSPGLRGGYAGAGLNFVFLRNYEYVPGVRVDLKLGVKDVDKGRFVLHISGPAAAKGVLIIDGKGRIRGTLGGRSFSIRDTALNQVLSASRDARARALADRARPQTIRRILGALRIVRERGPLRRPRSG